MSVYLNAETVADAWVRIMDHFVVLPTNLDSQGLVF